jgi:hypothetical protein
MNKEGRRPEKQAPEAKQSDCAWIPGKSHIWKTPKNLKESLIFLHLR